MGAIGDFMVADHVRLDALLTRAVATDSLDAGFFEEFRAGLLRHIGMEEKILLPAAKRARGGEPLPEAARLRIDHSALASLLVPTPTVEIVKEIRGLLEAHNPLEEGPSGIYAACDRLLANETEAILARLRAAPQVPLAPHFDGTGVHRTAESALRAAANKKKH